jgi:lipoprotein signal peptidase
MAVIPETSAARARGVRWAMLGTVAAVVVADQVSKALVLRFHPVAGPGFVTVRLVRNTGASGGIASGYPVLVTLAAIVIACVAGRGGSFNLSDLAIQLGVIGAIVAMFVADRPRKTRPQPAE